MTGPEACLLALALELPGAAWAQTVTGNDLLTACQAFQEQSVQAGFCAGYIIGQHEGFKAGSVLPYLVARPDASANELNALADETVGLCIPMGVEYSQHIDIIVRYLEEHPELRHEGARGLIYQAMQGAYPCPLP